MKISPWILGAAIAVPFAGAIAGSHIGTEPIGTMEDVSAFLPEQRIGPDAIGQRIAQSERTPDHYAMETPEGRVEVYELAMRGRYADRFRTVSRDSYDYEADIDRMEARWDVDESTSRAAAVLDAQQPRIRPDDRYGAVEAPHYAAMQFADTGRDRANLQAKQPKIDAPAPLDTEQPVTLAAVQTVQAKPRTVNVQAELARLP